MFSNKWTNLISKILNHVNLIELVRRRVEVVNNKRDNLVKDFLVNLAKSCLNYQMVTELQVSNSERCDLTLDYYINFDKEAFKQYVLKVDKDLKVFDKFVFWDKCYCRNSSNYQHQLLVKNIHFRDEDWNFFKHFFIAKNSIYGTLHPKEIVANMKKVQKQHIDEYRKSIEELDKYVVPEGRTVVNKVVEATSKATNKIIQFISQKKAA